MEVCMFCLFGASVGGTLYPEINTGHFTGNSIPTIRTLCKSTRLLTENHELKQRVYSDKFIVYTLIGLQMCRKTTINHKSHHCRKPGEWPSAGFLTGIPPKISVCDTGDTTSFRHLPFLRHFSHHKVLESMDLDVHGHHRQGRIDNPP